MDEEGSVAERIEEFEKAQARKEAARDIGRGALKLGKGLLSVGQAGIGAGSTAMDAAREHSVNIYFVILLLFHVFDGITNFKMNEVRLPFYFFIGAIVGWLWIFKGENPTLSEESLKALAKSAGLAATAFFFPFLLLKLGSMGLIDAKALGIIIAVFPVYVVWFVFVEPSTELLMKWQKIIVFIWLVIGIFWLYTAVKSGSIQMMPILQHTEEIDFLGAWGDMLKMFWDSIKGIWKVILEMIKKMIAGINRRIKGYEQATLGQFDVYTGKVDSGAKLKLGVYLEEVKASSKEYYNGNNADPINIWAILVARTLEKEISIKVRCWINVTEGNKQLMVTADKIYPNEQFVVYDVGETQEDIDCLFKRDTVQNEIKKAGAYPARISAEFNFETRAYIKSYFMDKEKSIALKREGIEPLEQFGIKDKNPMAVYTNGPLMIGMEIRKVPIELSTSRPDENQFTLGITIKNRWEGEIVKINKVRVVLPKQIIIKDSMCSGIYFSKEDCAKSDIECDDIFHNPYVMSDSAASGLKNQETFRCPLQVEDVQGLMADTPVATKYFKASVDYEYKLEKMTSVRIKQGTA